MTELLLSPNPYSRPGKQLGDVRGLVLHWVANPKTTARFNREFFESRKGGKLGYGSAHYIIDPTETILCVPETEVAYHAGAYKYTDYALDKFGSYPNAHSIGIELCHEDWAGTFHPSTLGALELLLRDLCDRYHLSPTKDVCRHHDITGKNCPKYWVDHPDEMQVFLQGV